MNFLVTGALGHIGSKLIRDLPVEFSGSAITMVDNLQTLRYCSLFSLPEKSNYKFINLDVAESDMRPLLKNIDCIIHLAATTDATASFENPERLEENNFNATKNIAKAAAECGTSLITISSTSVYGSQQEVVDENCTLGDLKPQSPYASCKLKEEDLVKTLSKELGLKSSICRFGTIFGTSPGMRFHTAVNKFCWQAVQKEPLSIWITAYNQKRPYLHLDDATKAISHIIRKNMFNGEIYNILSCNSTVKDVSDTIIGLLPDTKIKFVESRIMNQLSYEVSSEKFRRTGFNFSGTLEHGIAETIALLKNSNTLQQ
jgi:UDP-glucose 4-epimerase